LKSVRAAIVVCLATISAMSAADTLRCGSQLISVGDRTFEVQQKCGQPVSQEVIGYKETVSHFRQVDQVQVQEWVYGPNNGMYQYLRFEGGRLVLISSQRGK
jgi:PDZ domain-containing secreted protein